MGLFNKISLRKPKRTSFNLSYSTKFSLDFGRLVPIMCEKVVPGDKSYHSHEFFMRFAPFANQVFQGFQIRTEYFFVPTRLLWKNFEMWLSKGMLGDSTYIHPNMSYRGIIQAYGNQGKVMTNSVFDYFNLPTLFKDAGGEYNIDYSSLIDQMRIDPLPFFAYCKIFLDYYADENLDYAVLIEELENQSLQYAQDGNSFAPLSRLFARINNVTPVSQGSTTDQIDLRFAPFKRSWPKDYFTSALPFSQRGPIVQIPLNGSGDVIVTSPGSGEVYRYQNVVMTGNTPAAAGQEHIIKMYCDGDVTHGTTVKGGNPNNETENAITFKAVNINGNATITDLRTAIAIQEFLEKRARSGSRAKEQIYASFGVRTKDYRLDRAELLQAGTNYLNIGEVYTATANEGDTDIPGMAVSTGKAAHSSRQFKHFFEEHGYVIGLMSVFPTASYFQGIPRQFMELDQFDYYWPEFQHIGEQDVKDLELYLDDEGIPGTFGYQPRYSQYKSRLNQIHSEFRSNLKFMTSAREFTSQPHLSNDFVQISPTRDNLYKVFRVTDVFENSAPVYVDLFHHHKMVRPMSFFGIPRFK